jgi:predicted ATPase/DNA-binding winged helix-turn-helix (wHTH) protein
VAAHPVVAPTYSFDRFELDLGLFSLRAGEEEIDLEPQVMSLLAYLVQHHDTLVTRDEILDELWGHRFVSDSAVATQIKTLRKALGDDGRNQRIIKTVHGRGYRFVSPVSQGDSSPQPAPVQTTVRNSNLGYERTKLIGRDADLHNCIEAFKNYRLVSLLGIGGTGKTRLAKTVGRTVQADYPDGVWFVDLVPVRDGSGIDTAIASVMGISVRDGEARAQIADAVAEQRVLFILDNCEHIEEDVAAALDYLLENTTGPKFLATSRDPIDLADELRFFIDPLPVYSEAGVAPAVELFIMTAERHGMPETLLETAKVEQICARLDGLPLAIELAAAQLKQLTLDELAERLDRRFEVLAGRQREGGHRQDSLIRVVENTWQLLDEEEQRLLGQLAVFPGQFTVDDIEAVFAGQLPNGISFAMSRLVELCLLSRTSRAGGWWRLLETVRLFAYEKLTPQEREGNTQRHAEWVLERLGTYPEDHDVCCATSLMIQLDDGARALAKLKRIEQYLQDTTEVFELSRLHGTRALCAQVTRNPALLAEAAEINLELCREVGEGTRVAGALILTSLTNNFLNPELARDQLREAIQIAQNLEHPPTYDLVTTYQIWSYVVTGEFEPAVALAEPIAMRLLEQDRQLDNPTHNATCALAACLVFEAPEQALVWTQRLLERPEAHSLWGATLLFASVFASADDAPMAVRLIDEVEARLRRAGVSPWPDLLVPAIVLAYRGGEVELASAWYGAIRASHAPQQTFHGIAVYRQLRTILTPDAESLPLEEAGQAALQWIRNLG